MKFLINRLVPILPCATLLSAVAGHCANVDPTSASAHGPLLPVQTYQLPADTKGNFDHFKVDLKRSRLFATPEDFKAVRVFAIGSGKLVHRIAGIYRPRIEDGEFDNMKMPMFDARGRKIGIPVM